MESHIHHWNHHIPFPNFLVPFQTRDTNDGELQRKRADHQRQQRDYERFEARETLKAEVIGREGERGAAVDHKERQQQ